MEVSNLIFALCLGIASFFFGRNVIKVRRNIMLGRDIDRSDRSRDRWMTMARVALGQSKMVVRPVAGFLHILVYVGFVIINIEVLEIVIDGLIGTHRVFAFMGAFYSFLIGSFEILAFLVLLACVLFMIRRNVLQIKRFVMQEMKGWPKLDANLILIFEVVLMSAFLLMQGADLALQNLGADHYVKAGSFPISSFLLPLFNGMSIEAIVMIERACWWFHILGILAFLNYLPYSKHFHIILAFPNTYYSNLEPKGSFTNMASVKNEVQMMMDPNADPYAAPAEADDAEESNEKESKMNWREDVLLRVMEAAGISDRDAFIEFAADYDSDDNGYLKKGELEDAAKAWNAREEADSADDDSEESDSDDGSEEVNEKLCEICGVLNPIDAKECSACKFAFI